MARLGDLVDQIRGVSYKPEDVYDSLTDDSVALLRANNIKDGQLDFQDIIYISKKRVKGNQYLKAGDTLICTSSGSKDLVGKAAYIETDLPMVFGAFCKVIRPKIGNTRYLGHFFDSPYYRNIISGLSAGANINNIRNEHIDELEIRLPSAELQMQAVEVLNLVNRLICLRKQQLAKLDELVKARFVEMFGDPVENPLGWMQSTLKEVTLKIGSGATPKGGKETYQADGITLVRSMNVYDGYFEYKDLAHITDEQAKQLDIVEVFPNDIFINITGASVARSCIVPDDILPARVNQHVSIIRCDPKRLNHIFLNQLFLTSSYKKLLLTLGAAGGATRQAITKQQLEKLSVIVPPVETQNNFSQFATRVEKCRLTIQQGLDKLEVMKKALMQEYFG